MQGARRRTRWLLPALVVFLAACSPMGPGGMMGPNGMMGGRGMMGPVLPPPPVTAAPTATPGGPATVSFRRDVSPILDANCVRCHGGQRGLYVDSYERLMAGSATGWVVVPGEPGESPLVLRLRGEVQPRMPLDRPPLSEREITTIETWVREGAPNN